MSRVVNFVLGAALVVLAINSFFNILPFDITLSALIVAGIGVAILFIPIKPSGLVAFFRRWVVGIFVTLCGLTPFISYILPGEPVWLEYIRYGSWNAGLVLLIMGAIIFISAFKTLAKTKIEAS